MDLESDPGSMQLAAPEDIVWGLSGFATVENSPQTRASAPPQSRSRLYWQIAPNLVVDTNRAFEPREAGAAVQ